MWLLENRTSALLDGVSVNGKVLIIATTQRIHSNTYICATGHGEVTANILVLCEY